VSNHFSAAKLKFPGDDPRLDLTDLFMFAAPDDPGKTVLIMDSNPFMMGKEFHPDALYRINIDNDGDALADIAFSLTFSEPVDGNQTGTVYYATGSQARLRDPTGEVLVQSTPVGFDAAARPVHAGRCRLFAGVRSDPFFADAEGALHGFAWTGKDTFLGSNILSIALEVPNDMLGPGPVIGAWMSISVRRDGMWAQMDRGGNPSFNPILNPDEIKNEFNSTDPVDDVDNYVKELSETLEQHGYSHDEAITAALTLLPDILHYDRTKPAHYPNGRVMTDDCFSARMAFLTHGQVTSDGLKPHDDLLAEFPFLGLPNRTRSA
jgi:hypothetical protein